MARLQFGGTAADVAEDVSGARIPGAVGSVWNGPGEGASQITDLLDASGAPIVQLTADAEGMVPVFYGPDSQTPSERLWVDFGVRTAILATDVGDRLAAHVGADDPHGSKAAALAELNGQKGVPGGIASLDAGGRLLEAQLPDIAKTPSMVDWLNVKSPTYGAQGDGITDDTTAIKNAINAAGIGGVVYFPRGVYVISSTLDLPRGVALMGSHSNLMNGPGMVDDDFPCYIQAAPSMTSGAMIQIIGDNDGTHPAINGEQRIFNLMLDGSKLTTGNVDGIYAKGNVQNVVLRDVTIRKMTNNGIITAANSGGQWPYSWRLHSVMVDGVHANGMVFEQNTDLTLEDCQVIGSWSTGIKLTNCANTILTHCRAEWNGNYGFYLTGAWGNWPGSGAATVIGCSTDRNGWDGVRVDATGNGAFLVQGLMARRDGRNGGPGGGGYAGLRLSNQAPVVASGVTCYVGTDDGGTANTSPQYGLRIANARDVSVDNAYLHGLDKGLYDDGTSQRVSLGESISQVSGNNYSETRSSARTGYVNVRLFGAVGDGVADDTTALQAALDSLKTSGGVVYVPGGTYKTTAALTVYNGITIEGAGPSVSTIKQTSTTAHAIYGKDLRNVTIEKLGLMGPGSGTGSGVFFEPVGVVALNYLSFRDMFVQSFGGDGFHIVRTIVSNFERIISQTNGGWGFNLLAPADNVAGGTSVVMDACYGNGNTTGGIRLHRMSYSSLNACAVDSSPTGYQLDLSYGNTMTGCGVEDCATSIKINGGQGNTITGGFVYGSRGTCVYVTGGATGVGISHLVEQDPITASGAVNCIKTDAGTHVTVTGVTNVKANNYASGTVQILDDGTGFAQFLNGITVTGASNFGYGYFAGVIQGASHIVSDNGNVAINGVGKTLTVKEGTNAKMGVATLVNGTVTVSTTAVTATSRIQLTTQSPSGTVGSPYVNARTAGTSFVIKSTSSTDNSQVAWFLVEPS